MVNHSNLYGKIAETWKNPKKSEILLFQRERMIDWRKGNSIERLEHPTRLDRARSLGYKAKLGYIVVRSRVRGVRIITVSGTIKKCKRTMGSLVNEHLQII